MKSLIKACFFGSYKARAAAAIFSAIFLSSSCQDQSQIFRPDMIDPEKKLSRDDYKNTLNPKNSAKTEVEAPKTPQIPDLSQIIMPPPQVAKGKLITISVTEDVPLKDVLIEIARKADLDLELDPGIRGGIIFRAKDRPFHEVIERISELTNLKYSVKNGILKINIDYPYIVNYSTDFLNQKRSHKGQVTISTSVLSSKPQGGSGSGTSGTTSGTPSGSSGSSSGSEAFSTGSKSQVDSEYDGDMWKSVDDNLKAIIENYRSIATGLKTAEVAVPLGQAAPVPAVPPEQRAFYTINKAAGIITVMANERLQREIKRYIDKIKISQSAQVLIEAKIVEVTLAEQFQSGIRWGLILNSGVRSNIISNFNDLGSAATTSDLVSVNVLPQELFGSEDATIDGILSFTERFGVSRTLSSPRINAVNNQQAVLTFAKNTIYFKVDLSEETREGTGVSTDLRTVSVNSQVNTVPVGVILTLQPSINLDTNEITMNIRPTLSRITDRIIEDPGTTIIARRLGLSATEIENRIPEIEVRELDSVLKIKSGQIMVIGGLMEERSANEDRGIPGAKRLPIVGNLFGSKNNLSSTVETVIFIKATIVPGQGVSDADRQIYETFTNDPRPLF